MTEAAMRPRGARRKMVERRGQLNLPNWGGQSVPPASKAGLSQSVLRSVMIGAEVTSRVLGQI